MPPVPGVKTTVVPPREPEDPPVDGATTGVVETPPVFAEAPPRHWQLQPTNVTSAKATHSARDFKKGVRFMAIRWHEDRWEGKPVVPLAPSVPFATRSCLAARAPGAFSFFEAQIAGQNDANFTVSAPFAMASALQFRPLAMTSNVLKRACLFGLLSALVLASVPARSTESKGASTAAAGRLTVVGVDREPPPRAKPGEAELAQLRKSIEESPKLRKPRFDLVHTLVRAGRFEEARTEANSWREHDAYSLVAVRQLGDIESSLGETARARRTYSAIVELLPKDVEARRALATILKQAGDYEGARSQLLEALELRADDRRTTFELGDVEQHMGLDSEARARFEATSNAADASESLRYPAKQRLSQIYASLRRSAVSGGDSSGAEALAKSIQALGIHGGTENDIKVYLSWDTDRTDIDLWVTTPDHEKVFYSHKQGAHGEALHDDVTNGYGPESFTAHDAQAGEYLVQVNFFGAHGAFKEARGEVIVILNEGSANETRQVFPYRIFDEKDTVTVAKVRVNPSTGASR